MPEVLNNSTTLQEAITLCLHRNLHFAAYRLPGEKNSTLIIQQDPVVQIPAKMDHHLPEKGFLIAPFSREHNDTWLIRPDIILHNTITGDQIEKLQNLPEHDPYSLSPFPDDTTKAEYIKLISDSVVKIKRGDFEKVVLSRVKSLKGKFRMLMPQVFMALCSAYPDAFVYLFCVKGQCWIGASPEPFVCSHDQRLKTVSLAGTRPLNKHNAEIGNWKHKELEEQEYVTQHIEKILKVFDINPVEKNGPYVIRAGNLMHLRTDFSFDMKIVGRRLPALIHALHPTPAVCGMSTGQAMDFIRNFEKHNREFYAGFLGPVGFADKLCLFVNLRCMKVYDDRLILYIGGGITGESIPEEEWEETEIKAETLLSVIKEIQ
jgi:isochorismate synthase